MFAGATRTSHLLPPSAPGSDKFMHAPPIQMAPVTRPNPRNARIHSKKQIKQIADSIQQFGFTNPVLIGDDGEIIAGQPQG